MDLNTIREEALQMIQQVAKIYNPDSQNPLLETSLDQLARAASRICLHVLVLLEQLPVSVQHYNANKLYGYMQKAIASYGVYQKASPWLYVSDTRAVRRTNAFRSKPRDSWSMVAGDRTWQTRGSEGRRECRRSPGDCNFA